MTEKEDAKSKLPWGIILGLIGTIITVAGTIIVANIGSSNELEKLRVQNEINLTNTAIARIEAIQAVTLQAQLATDTPIAIVTATSTVTSTPSNTPTDTPSTVPTETVVIPTEKPSDTPLPTSPPTAIPTPITIPTQAARAYPCDATINAAGSDAIRIQVVYSQPLPQGIRLDPIRVDTQVQVVNQRDTPSNGRWYQIAGSNGTRLGWVHQNNLHLSTDCPS